MTHYDVVIVGGGPAGLAAALALGRARRRVLLCDAGGRRNGAALHVQNFVTRDGIPPAEFRRIAREQLERYTSVDIRDVHVEGIGGERGSFQVRLESRRVVARRVLLCTGMIDELPPMEGFPELWGRSIFACPYCHGWEVQDRRFGYLAGNAEALPFALLLRSWSRDVVAFTDGRFSFPSDLAAQLADGGVHVDERRIARLRANGGGLHGLEFADGSLLERDVLFAHPPQQQVAVVRDLGVALDPRGFVRIDETTRETSLVGVYAAGDLTTPVQSAVIAAAAGMQAAAMANRSLALDTAAWTQR